MNKLKLDVERIVVEAFSVLPDAAYARGGTVAGHGYSEAGSCRGATCNQSCNDLYSNCVCHPTDDPGTGPGDCGSADFSCDPGTCLTDATGCSCVPYAGCG